MRTIYEDLKRYFLYVGFGLLKSELKYSTESIRLEFRSTRERKEFRELLLEKNPRNIDEVKRLYENVSSPDLIIEASVKT